MTQQEQQLVIAGNEPPADVVVGVDPAQEGDDPTVEHVLVADTTNEPTYERVAGLSQQPGGSTVKMHLGTNAYGGTEIVAMQRPGDEAPTPLPTRKARKVATALALVAGTFGIATRLPASDRRVQRMTRLTRELEDEVSPEHLALVEQRKVRAAEKRMRKGKRGGSSNA